MIEFIIPGRVVAILIVIGVSSGCASSTSQLEREGCAGLTLLPETGSTRVGLSDDHGPEGYGRAMLDGVRVQSRPVGSSSSGMAPRPPGTRYPVGPEQRKELEKLAEEGFESALDGLQLEPVDEAGAGVLLVRGQILDVFFEAPTDPESGANYLLDRVGRAMLVVELIDSESGTLLLRAYDDRSAGSAGPDGVSQIAALWGEMLVESIGYLRAAKPAN
jgi:hypothetical protein